MKRAALLALFLILASVNAFATAPSVFPGGPYTGYRNTDIYLNGYATCDGCTITYINWSLPAGSNCNLRQSANLDQNRNDAVISCPDVITIDVNLTADNDLGERTSALSPLSISNRQPVAVLKADPHQGNPPLTVTFSGACSDPDGNAIKTCFLDYQDGNGEAIAAPYYFSGKTHTYYTVENYYPELMVKDDQDANNSDRARETINVIAPAAPTISNKSPTGDINNVRPTVSFDVNDSGSGVNIATLQLFIDGNLISPTTNQVSTNYHVSWAFDYNLANGKIVYIGLRVADNIGNSTSDVNWNFTVDMEAPTISSITISDNDGYTNDTTPTITLNSVSGSPTLLALSCNNSSWKDWQSYASSVENFSLTTSDFGCPAGSNGSFTIYLKLKDAAGNQSSVVSDPSYLDTTNPSSPSNLTANSESDGDIYLDWDAASDSGSSGIVYYIYRGTSSGFSPGTEITTTSSTGYTNDEDNLSDGTRYYYKVKAKDRAGNFSGESNQADAVSTTTVTPSGDTTAPYLAWKQPSNNSTVSGVVALQVEAYDSQSDMRFVSFWVDGAEIGTDATAAGDIYSIDWNSAKVANGKHTLRALAKNWSGNTGYDSTTKEITVTTDNAGAALTPEQSTARNAIDATDDAKEQAAALFNEASKLGISFSATAGKLLSDGSGLLDEANGLFDDANYSGAEKKADAANAKFEELLDAVSIEEYGAVQVYAFSSEKLQLLLQGIGLRKELADEAQALLQNFTVNRSTLFKEITDGSNTYYKAAVRLVIKNNGTERKAVQFIEVIPKGFAADANQIAESSNFAVIVADPVIKWAVSVPAGEEKEITYVLKENLSKEKADQMLAAQPMQLFVVPPILLGSDTAVAALDFTPAPAAPTGFFALPDLGSVGTLALVLVIAAVIAIALFAYYRGSSGSGNFGGSGGLHNFGMQEGLGKRLGGRLAGFGRAKEKEQRPRWEFRG